jgi:hypothetical protein
MNSDQPTKESWKWYVLAGALLTGGPVWHYLYVNGYPLARAEFLVLPLLGALAGVAVAFAAYKLGRVIGAAVFGLLLLLFLDLQFNISPWPIKSAALAAICVLASVVLRQRIAFLTALVLLTFNATSLPQYGNNIPDEEHWPDRTISGHPPLLVHIILDEQWGIGGLRAAGDTVLAEYLAKFYHERGFQVYESAYSRYRRTRLSIPSLVGLGTLPEVHKLFDRRIGPTYRLTTNPYFARLQKRGYGVTVFQTTFLDFCHSRGISVNGCDVAAATSVSSVGDMRGTWIDRGVVAGRLFLTLESYFYNRFTHDGQVWRRTFAGRGLRQLNEIRDAILDGPPQGKAIFAHVMLPHRPLEVNAECQPGERVYEATGPDTAAFRRKFMALYNAQVRCVHQSIDEIVDAVDRKVGRDGAVIVIHGDHGSRFSGRVRANISAMSDHDLNTNYSTLLAVRGRGIHAGVRTEPVPVQDLFWEFVRSDFAEVPTRAWKHYVLRELDDPGAALRQLDAAKMVWVRRP